MKLSGRLKEILNSLRIFYSKGPKSPCLYRTFYLNESEFAVGGKYFRGMMNIGESKNSFVEIGERKVPLIDLQKLIKLPSENFNPYEKIVLLEVDNIFFGISCHREGNQIHDEESVKAPIINVQSLLSPVQTIVTQKTLITFGPEKQYAIDVEDIGEIIPYPKLVTTSAILPEILKGYFMINGERVYIVDTGMLCDSGAKSTQSSKELLIIKKDNLPYALMVDTFNFYVSFPNDRWIKLHRDPKDETSTQETYIHSSNGESRVFHIVLPDTIIRKVIKIKTEKLNGSY